MLSGFLQATAVPVAGGLGLAILPPECSSQTCERQPGRPGTLRLLRGIGPGVRKRRRVNSQV